MNHADLLPNVAGEDIFIASTPTDVKIHIRRKFGNSGGGVGEPKPVLFVHGATFSGMSAFDAPIPGGSWLDFAAAHGWDAYALDVRGYGMSAPSAVDEHGTLSSKPYARTTDAIADVEAAVDFIRERTGVDRIDLVGWSWGTAICGGFAAENPGKVRRLVQYAPLWTVRHVPGAVHALLPQLWAPALGPIYSMHLGAFRTVSLADVRRRWFRGLDERTASELCSREDVERWWQHAVRLEQEGASQAARTIRAPNGVIADVIEYWSTGIPTYDPARIRAAVLCVVGEWDVDTPLYMAQELFNRLTASPYKRLEVLGRGTHSMSLEVNRFDLYYRVHDFLSMTLV